MVKPVDYSKWDHIECSDDDTETLPTTIDKKSFEKYQKEKRKDRDQDEVKQKNKLEKRLAEVKDKLEQLGQVGREHASGKKLQEEQKEIEQELERLDRMKHWNWENICHTVEDKTEITSYPDSYAPIPASKSSTDPSKVPTGPSRHRPEDAQLVEGYADFCEKYAQIADDFIERLGRQEMKFSEQFLIDNPSLLSEHSPTYMMLDCLEKEMNGHHAEMVIAARQQQLVVQILELAKSAHRPAQDGVKALFQKFRDAEQFEDSFQDEVDRFIKKVEARAVTKKKEMDEEAGRESSDDEMMSPDPQVQEVLDELPKEMRDAFRKQDIRALHLAVAGLPREKGKYYMRRCEEVGLWNAGEGEDEPPYRQED